MPNAAPQLLTRARVSQSTDPRAEAVRSDLFAAAAHLGRLGGRVTVTSLAREAGVSRSTFYAHFADLADFAIALQHQYFGALASVSEVTNTDPDRERAALAQLRAMVAHFIGNRDLYRTVFTLSGRPTAGEDTMLTLEQGVLRFLKLAHRLPPGVRTENAARFLAGGMTAVLANATIEDRLVDEEALARDLYAMLPAWMHQPAEHPRTTAI